MTNKRNVVLVTADSIRADYCGFLNSALDTTPRLTEMASDALVYETAIAPGPRTPSSIPVIFTGTLMSKSDRSLEERRDRISKIRNHMDSCRSVVQDFQDNGYTTIGFTTNPWTSETARFDSGFDHFEVISRKSYNEAFPFTTRLGQQIYARFGKAIEYTMDWWNREGWFSQWPTFYDKVVTAVRDTEEPFFLWVFLLDTHNPYIVPRTDRIESSTLGMYHSILRANSVFVENDQDRLSSYGDDLPNSVEYGVKKAYRDSIRSVDRFVGEVRDEFAEHDPVIVFHSDHGEAFGEHGSYGHQPAMYSENLRVPLLIHNLGERNRIRRVVSLADLPAILRACLIEQEPPTIESNYAISQNEQGTRFAIRNDRWSLVIDEAADESQQRLYDLENDPQETSNVVYEFPEVRDELVDVVERNIITKDTEPKVNGIDESMARHLESLGYK